MSLEAAANYLMRTGAPASFHGPAPYTPDGPEDRPYSDEDHEYDLYLIDWIARVECGDMDVVEAPEWIS